MYKRYKEVLIDCDGCITDTVKAVVSLYNEDFKAYDKFTYINWWEINTWDFKECSCAAPGFIDTYFNQQRFFDKLEFMPLAKETIMEIQEFYKVKIVSHGFSPNLRLKEVWVEENLPGVEFIGVNLKKCKDKSCIDMEDCFFMDDNSKNLFTCNAKDKACFGDIYSWNSDWNGKRLLNWTDVRNYLL